MQYVVSVVTPRRIYAKACADIATAEVCAAEFVQEGAVDVVIWKDGMPLERSDLPKHNQVEDFRMPALPLIIF